jgi:hypothetical protein
MNKDNKPKDMKVGKYEEILEKKKIIEVSGIFGEKPYGKVLVLDRAGVGKSSLMHFISYKWAKNQLWKEEFDYVFRVRFKDLNTDCEKNFRAELENFSQADLFAYFLHNSLVIGNERLDNLKNF